MVNYTLSFLPTAQYYDPTQHSIHLYMSKMYMSFHFKNKLSLCCFIKAQISPFRTKFQKEVAKKNPVTTTQEVKPY